MIFFSTEQDQRDYSS